MSWLETIKKSIGSPIKKKGFKKIASKKTVKTRTIYRAVSEYEKEFKHEYANMVGDVATEVMKTVTKQLYKK